MLQDLKYQRAKRQTAHFAPTPRKLSRSRLGSSSVLSVTALAGVPDFVRRAFGERVLQRANRAAMLDIEAIDDQNCFIPHITMTTFANTVAKLSGEENFGLVVAPHLSITNYGCWGEYMLSAPTLGAAVERGAATIGFHSKGDVFSITIADCEARLSYVSAAKGMDGYPHVACGTAGVLVSICRAFLSAHWRPLRIELDIPRPRRPNVFEDAFDCPVLFDAPRVSVCFEATLLRMPPCRPGRYSLITIADLARARLELSKLDSLRDIVAQQIWSQLLTGNVSIESAACSLGTSVRTLQRELNREGTDFRSLANTMRTKRATELLRQTDGSITTIAATLGYSAPNHFARAFHKATGMNPTEFRQQALSHLLA
jgi:AraC-like DNA-binding protein